MRTINFAKRCFKEIIREPISLTFTIVLPLFLLFIFQQFNIPSESFELKNFTPGIIVFAFSFISLFTATLVAKDRTTSLLVRLGVSPMKPSEYICGYIVSLIPLIIIQEVLFFLLANIMGLPFTIGVIYACLISIIVSIFFIAMGILIGSLTSEKGASGISSVVVQLVCFTSGMYFPKEILGKTFRTICEYLPFDSIVTILRNILNNNISQITLKNIVIFGIYFILIFVLAIVVFKKKMTSDK